MYEAIIKINPSDDPAVRARNIKEGIEYACMLLLDEYALSADNVIDHLERVVDSVYDHSGIEERE